MSFVERFAVLCPYLEPLQSTTGSSTVNATIAISLQLVLHAPFLVSVCMYLCFLYIRIYICIYMTLYVSKILLCCIIIHVYIHTSIINISPSFPHRDEQEQPMEGPHFSGSSFSLQLLSFPWKSPIREDHLLVSNVLHHS